MPQRARTLSRWSIIVLSVVFIFYGVSRGEVDTVKNKAINICLECIGLG